MCARLSANIRAPSAQSMSLARSPSSGGKQYVETIGGPTLDKPDITLTAPKQGDPISSFLNVRVANIAAFYAAAKSKGAQFLTEPLDRKAEMRCYLRDPDGYLIEIGQATGMLHGIFVDLPAQDD
jgi:hypothetical protein